MEPCDIDAECVREGFLSPNFTCICDEEQMLFGSGDGGDGFNCTKGKLILQALNNHEEGDLLVTPHGVGGNTSSVYQNYNDGLHLMWVYCTPII